MRQKAIGLALVAFALAGLWVAEVASAQGEDRLGREGLEPTVPDAEIASMVTRLFVATALIAGFSVLSVLAARRWLVGTYSSGLDSEAIKLLAARNLDHKTRVFLVQVEQHKFLVASDATGAKSVVVLPPNFELEGEPPHEGADVAGQEASQ